MKYAVDPNHLLNFCDILAVIPHLLASLAFRSPKHLVTFIVFLFEDEQDNNLLLISNFLEDSQRIHVWYIYLHLVDVYALRIQTLCLGGIKGANPIPSISQDSPGFLGMVHVGKIYQSHGSVMGSKLIEPMQLGSTRLDDFLVSFPPSQFPTLNQGDLAVYVLLKSLPKTAQFSR